MTLAIRKLHFAYRIAVTHHDGADLTASQAQRLSGLEMYGRGIRHERNDIMQLKQRGHSGGTVWRSRRTCSLSSNGSGGRGGQLTDMG